MKTENTVIMDAKGRYLSFSGWTLEYPEAQLFSVGRAKKLAAQAVGPVTLVIDYGLESERSIKLGGAK